MIGGEKSITAAWRDHHCRPRRLRVPRLVNGNRRLVVLRLAEGTRRTLFPEKNLGRGLGLVVANLREYHRGSQNKCTHNRKFRHDLSCLQSRQSAIPLPAST